MGLATSNEDYAQSPTFLWGWQFLRLGAVFKRYLTLPPGWAGSYTCPVLRPYQFGPMRVPECNHKVTGSCYKAAVGCEAETSTKALVT